MSPIIWFSVGLSALFAVAPFFGKMSFRDGLVVGIFGSSSFLQAYLYLFSTQQLYYFPALFTGHIPAMVLLSTCLYLYVLLRLEDRATTLDDLSHFIPFLMSVGAYSVVLLSPKSFKLHALTQLYSEQQSSFLQLCTGLSALICVAYLARTLLLDSGYHSFDIRKRPGITGVMLLTSIILVSVLSIGIVPVRFNLHIIRFVLPVFACLFICASAIHLRHPDHFLGWISDVKKTYQKRYYLNEINVSQTRTALVSLMNKDHYYRDNALTLPKLAELLGISKYQLSQLLNQDMQTTFVKFIQEYRVDAAKHLLKTQPNRTILSIAFEVGFNSQSAFQAAFKTCTSMTPSEYRDRS